VKSQRRERRARDARHYDRAADVDADEHGVLNVR
jgi:hypothetical protein